MFLLGSFTPNALCRTTTKGFKTEKMKTVWKGFSYWIVCRESLAESTTLQLWEFELIVQSTVLFKLRMQVFKIYLSYLYPVYSVRAPMCSYHHRNKQQHSAVKEFIWNQMIIFLLCVFNHQINDFLAAVISATVLHVIGTLLYCFWILITNSSSSSNIVPEWSCQYYIEIIVKCPFLCEGAD